MNAHRIESEVARSRQVMVGYTVSKPGRSSALFEKNAMPSATANGRGVCPTRIRTTNRRPLDVCGCLSRTQKGETLSASKLYRRREPLGPDLGTENRCPRYGPPHTTA